MCFATLKDKRWLSRTLIVTTRSGQFEICYNANGIGYEEILVDGISVIRKKSIAWYVPEFVFRVGEFDATVKVRVWVWFQLKSFSLEIDGETVYSE
jgi:hypothetical protein